VDAEARKAVIDRLQPWFCEMASALHLNHWYLTVPIETRPDSPDHAASVERIYGQNRAKIFLSDGFLEDEPENQRLTYCHELLHCHFRAIIEARDSLEELLGKPANTLFVCRMRDAEELAVDAIATAIAPFLPLPPGGEE
jgi:hypothetical protein